METKAEPVIKKIGLYLAPILASDIPNSGEKRSSGLNLFFDGPRQMFVEWDNEQTVNGFRYLPPQDGDGTVTHYTLMGSTDWKNWTELASGEFSNIVNNPIWQSLSFPATKVRVVKFVADRLASGERMGYNDVEVVMAE